eukprot:scaffold23147_cov147-Isochrysis_galbana.AAC.5
MPHGSRKSATLGRERPSFSPRVEQLQRRRKTHRRAAVWTRRRDRALLACEVAPLGWAVPPETSHSRSDCCTGALVLHCIKGTQIDQGALAYTIITDQHGIPTFARAQPLLIVDDGLLEGVQVSASAVKPSTACSAVATSSLMAGRCTSPACTAVGSSAGGPPPVGMSSAYASTTASSAPVAMVKKDPWCCARRSGDTRLGSDSTPSTLISQTQQFDARLVKTQIGRRRRPLAVCSTDSGVLAVDDGVEEPPSSSS